jgi:uncharacterized protein with HEPN domain
MDNKDIQLLNKILQEIDIVGRMTYGFNFDSFNNDEKTKRAVCMTLINIGELVKNLSEGLKEKETNIPWRAIAGMRDIAAHKYQTLKAEDVWETLNQDIQPLKEVVLRLL